MFSYTLSKPAKVTGTLRSSTGRTAQVLQDRVPARAGTNSVTWSGRGRDGKALPRGAYVWEILAVETTGRAVRAMRALSLR